MVLHNLQPTCEADITGRVAMKGICREDVTVWSVLVCGKFVRKYGSNGMVKMEDEAGYDLRSSTRD